MKKWTLLIFAIGSIAQAFPAEYPTTINNPVEFVEFQIPNGDLLGLCEEGNGKGIYSAVVENTYGQPEIFETFHCTVRAVALKKAQVSAFWTPVFTNQNHPTPGFLTREINGIELKAAFTTNIYFHSKDDLLGVHISLTGKCRKTKLPYNFGGNQEIYELCDSSEFAQQVVDFAKIGRFYLRQNFDRTILATSTCVGTPGSVVQPIDQDTGNPVGPPTISTGYPANRYIDCKEIH